MSDIKAELAELLAEHTTALRDIDRRPAPTPRDQRVLRPADQQRGATPPRITADQGSSARSSST